MPDIATPNKYRYNNMKNVTSNHTVVGCQGIRDMPDGRFLSAGVPLEIPGAVLAAYTIADDISAICGCQVLACQLIAVPLHLERCQLFRV